jgi:hypothetical protein
MIRSSLSGLKSSVALCRWRTPGSRGQGLRRQDLLAAVSRIGGPTFFNCSASLKRVNPTKYSRHVHGSATAQYWNPLHLAQILHYPGLQPSPAPDNG